MNARPQPFEEILIPFIYFARERLKERVRENYDTVAETAHIELERSLLFWLSHLNAMTMEAEFSAFRAAIQSIWGGYSKPKKRIAQKLLTKNLFSTICREGFAIILKNMQY